LADLKNGAIAAIRSSHWRSEVKLQLSLVLGTFCAMAASINPPAGAVFKQPQLAASAGMVALTYGSDNTIWFAGSADGGKTFTSAVKVAQPAGLMLGMHRGPRVVISGNNVVISAVTSPRNGGDGNLVAWHSTDGGRTWSKPVHLNDKNQAAREGLHAMAAGPGGMLYAVWLDDRDGGKALVGAYSSDGGATWSANELIYKSPDGHICECCHPSVAIDSNGVIYAMFRNWLGGSRDMYLAVSKDNGKTFDPAAKLGNGTWKLNGCPMDGGGVTLNGSAVEVVFRRGETIYTDQPGAPEIAIGKGKNPAIAGSAVLWTDTDGVHALRDHKSALLASTGAFPAVASANGKVIAAWEADGKIVVTDKLP
jgi:hypothetical protein